MNKNESSETTAGGRQKESRSTATGAGAAPVAGKAPFKPAGMTSALSDYYSASQLRNDRWTALKSLAVQLASATNEAKRVKLTEKIQTLLRSLGPIEAYWAFPGRRGLEQLLRMMARQDHADFSRAVTRMVRALQSGTYRRRLGDYFSDTDRDLNEEEEIVETREARTRARPFFEILIVDDLS
ncbi:hypothetical protein, partial [Dokdonella sp.]|uniref:hypothetical protein n=1 Tax=Dokdonella sp. TaxID=2291710 RepID=UPI003C4D0562